MSENYFYSSLSAQQIENTLVGAVVANAAQSLTTSQKAQARANIGAGAVDTGLIIKGYYATAADLESAHPIAAEGDVYMVGTAAPYDTYIWDAVNMEWKNNGALTPGDSTIDDNDISTTHTWSSSKINTQLGTKQAAISAVGMLKGTGSAVQAATLGSDYTAVDDSSSASTSKTWSITKIGQAIAAAIAGLVSFATAQTLTDAQKSQARGNIGAVGGWELLWTNPNPSNDFAAQTVPLDLSPYSEICIEFKHWIGSASLYSPAIQIVGLSGFLISFGNATTGAAMQYHQRAFSSDNNGVTFESSTARAFTGTAAATTQNGNNAPMFIYAR